MSLENNRIYKAFLRGHNDYYKSNMEEESRYKKSHLHNKLIKYFNYKRKLREEDNG